MSHSVYDMRSMPSLAKVHDLLLVFVVALKPQVRAYLKRRARAVRAMLALYVLRGGWNWKHITWLRAELRALECQLFRAIAMTFGRLEHAVPFDC